MFSNPYPMQLFSKSLDIDKICYLLLWVIVKNYPGGIDHNKHSKWQLASICFLYSQPLQKSHCDTNFLDSPFQKR